MSGRFRFALLLLGLAGVLALLGAAYLEMPPFGRPPIGIARFVNEVAIPVTHATNVVAAAVFDVRVGDTLVEEFILFAAASGTALLLRATREEAEEPPQDAETGRQVPDTSAPLTASAVVLAAASVVFGAAMAFHGHLTPGGGFQGGVVLATAVLVLYVADRYRTFQRVSSEEVVERAEAFGAAGFVVIGIGALAAGAAFLANVLPDGTAGQLLSAGTIPLLNVVVAVEVAAAFVLIITEFLEQAVRVRGRGGS